jgi:transposase
MKATVTLTQHDQTRLVVLNRILDGHLTAAEAAAVLNLSVRQVRRLLAAYREDGAAALIHGNRGRAPVHALDPTQRHQILTLVQTRYAGVNDQQLTELLAEHDGIVVSRSSVRRILRTAGVASPRTRRPPKHRQRRERRAQAGLLVQLDGSPHRWLDGRGPAMNLLAAIDDATGTVVAAVFREQEDAHGYFQLIQDLITTQGRPVAVYHDRHSIFRVVTGKETIEEQLAGQRTPTQFGRLLQTLGIHSIVARSPQAKGRVERLFGTLQDRLVVELRLAGIETLEAANQFLGHYLPRFNARFAVPAADPASAYRPLDPSLDLARTFAFIHERTVAADNTLAFAGQRLQLLATPQRASYARCRVTVHEHLDGQRSVTYQGQLLPHRPAPADAAARRAQATRPPADTTASTVAQHTHQTDAPPATIPPAQAPHRPAKNHPWRTPRSNAATPSAVS